MGRTHLSHKALFRAGRVECALCYAGARGREAHPGHFSVFGFPARREMQMAEFLRRVQPLVPGVGGEAPLRRVPNLSVYPALGEFLTLDRWEDGSPRQPGSISLFVEEGKIKACLNDKENNRVAFVSAGSWEGLLEQLETGIKDDSLDWRRSRDRKRG